MNQGADAYTKYQTITDFSKVRNAGIEFLYVKTTDGMSAKPTNGWGLAGRKAGIAMGAYGYAEPGDPVTQYDFLCQQAAANGLMDLGPACDLEAPFTPGAAAQTFAIAWLRRAVQVGNLPVLYANDSMWSYIGPAVLAAVPNTWRWVARYGAAPKNTYETWQYSSSGTVPGITASAVDLNTGKIPYNTVAQPTGDLGHFDGDDDVTQTFAAGTDVHESIIVIGKTKLWFATADLGDGPVTLTSIDFYGATPASGSAGAGVGGGIRNAQIDPHRPGPLPIPPGAVMAQIRYTANHSFGVGAS